MNSMTLHGKSLIGGEIGAGGGAVFHATNPANASRLPPEFHEAAAAEVNCALDAVAEAFAVYRARPSSERAEFLETIAREIEALGDPLLQRAQAETGLPLPRLQGERARTGVQLRLFAQVVREGSWVDARIDTASAFAAGCPVVVKAHRAHPGTSELVGGAILRAAAACRMPPGIFSLLHGSGATVGIALVKHPATPAVGFTGSHTAGRALFDAAAAREHPIPVFAEMSSLNPVFLLPSALRERGAALANALVGSFTLGVGQFCTKPGLIFALQDPATDAFLQALISAVEAAPCGTMLTAGIREAFLSNQTRIATAAGVRVLTAARAAPDPAKTEAQPSVAVTTAQQFLATPALASEAFGPFTLIVLGDTAGELAACAQALDGQLTATVHGTGDELAAARPLLVELERKAGRIVINGFPTGVEVCPAMNHGGPYPATTDARFTSVGTAAILRFARPICYQSLPDAILPAELRNDNPLGLMRLVNGAYTRDKILAAVRE